MSGGRGELGAQEQTIRTLAGARTLAQLEATRIVLPGGREVRLADLGTVEADRTVVGHRVAAVVVAVAR